MYNSMTASSFLGADEIRSVRHVNLIARCREFFTRRRNHNATLILPAEVNHAYAHPQSFSNSTYSPSQSLTECMLLTRLPFEIRLLIYAYVFSRSSTYFTFHRRSYPPDPGYTNIFGDDLLKYHIFPESNLNLLQTCKQIYTEAKPTALNNILFHIIQPMRNPEAARKPLLAAELGSMIGHLKVRWVYCNEPQVTVGGIRYEKTENDAWEELWATVASVCASTTRTLRSLKIEIQAAGQEVEILNADSAEWLRPLRQIRGVRGLEVEILYSKNNKMSKDVMCEGLSQRMCEIMSNQSQIDTPEAK